MAEKNDLKSQSLIRIWCRETERREKGERREKEEEKKEEGFEGFTA